MKQINLAVWFIPKLQRHLGLNPTSRLKIIAKFLCGHKEIIFAEHSD